MRSHALPADLDALVQEIQNQLFVVGADLATPGSAANIPRIGESHTVLLEQTIDQLEAELPPLRQFILPGGCPAAAALHFARTICRRAERAIVSLSHEEAINPAVLAYINRLSDCLFVLARIANLRANIEDVPWVSPRLANKPPDTEHS